MRQQIIDKGLPDPGPVGAFRSSGPLLTRSLLFIGIRDDKPVLRALDKATGELIHQLELPTDPAGTPMTYMVNGKQFISMAVGARADAKLVTYALP
jgi:quinoprotein glucose dehydrogenase